MKFQLITNRQDLDDISEEWNDVLRASASDSIFLTWEWVSAWLDTVHPDARLLVVIVRDLDGRLMAIAPFYRSKMRLLRMIGYRTLRILGDYLSGAEYPNIIVRAEWEDAGLSAIAQFLETHRREWDCAWIPNVAGWTGAAQHFSKLACAGNVYHRSRPRAFTAIPIPQRYEEYEKTLSKNSRHHLRRTTRKVMDQLGGTLVSCTDEQQLDRMLPALFRLHQKRWESVGQNGSLGAPGRRAFYRRLSKTLLPLGHLGFFGLIVENEFRALWYGFIYRGIYYSLSSAYDVQFEEKHRTGVTNVLFGQMLRLLIERGIHEFDHLGELAEYKSRWGAVPRAGSDVLLCSKSLKGMLLFLSGVWPTGKYISMDEPSEQRNGLCR